EEYHRKRDMYRNLVKQGKEYPEFEQELYGIYDSIARTLGLMTFLLHDPLKDFRWKSDIL
ncbi:MAG: hypothetical protein SVK08_06640, partial [Halobacteriota archaeon]|nr:hypothetical protein [Halobacteriota archaeon]